MMVMLMVMVMMTMTMMVMKKAKCVLSVSGFLVVYTRGRRTYVDGQVTTTHKPALLCHSIKESKLIVINDLQV